MGLNHRRFPRTDGLARSGHTGSWQGFTASIQRYPEHDLTVIALANLAQGRPAAIAVGVAGILEPALTPAHLSEDPETRPFACGRAG